MSNMSPLRRAAVGVALVATAVAGGAVGASMMGSAGAQTTSTTASTEAGTPAAANGGGYGSGPAGQFDPTKGGHVGANGVKEVLLTGDTATKVRAAASAAVPGATIQRVETDAEGSPYEAHMTKADGTRVTVKVDKAFKVTSVENDGSGGPHGQPGAGTPAG
jgi:hypothetical protein